MDAATDSPAAVATWRVTSRRRTNHKLAALQAGKAKDASSFISIENPEATIAAYCGCNNIGSFRIFYTGPLVMPFYIKSLTYRGYQRRTVLSLLEDLPFERYWASDEDPEKVYPVMDKDTRKTNLNYGIGLVLWPIPRRMRTRSAQPQLVSLCTHRIHDQQVAVDATLLRAIGMGHVYSHVGGIPARLDASLRDVGRCGSTR